MIILTLENPYVFIDSYGDEYRFYIFTDVKGNRHFDITVIYADSKKTIPIFGYEVPSTGFALPLDGDAILWSAYDNVPGASPRGKCMSEEARKRASKLLKLKAFL